MKRVWKDFGKQNLGEYHDLYVKTNTLLGVTHDCQHQD